MKHFINRTTSMVHAFEEDGSQDEYITEDMDSISVEELAERRKPKPREELMLQIRTLERTITARRLREAVLGVDGGWLERVDAQLAELRQALES